MYEYDDAGRIASTLAQAEPEWDEQDRDWLLALAEFESTLCPRCGRPMSVCTSQELELQWQVPLPTRCHATTAVMRAQESRTKGGTTKFPEALLWHADLPER